MENFDLKAYLRNNQLLTEAKEEEKEEVKEGYGKMKKSELKEKIREEILEAMKAENDDPTVGDEEEAHSGVEEGFGKTLKNVGIGALGALGLKKYGIDMLNKFMEVLPEEKAQELSDIIQTLVDMGQNLFEADEEEADIDVDAELDIEEPAEETPEEDPFGDVEDDVEGAEKEAYEGIIAAGRAYKKLGEDADNGGLKTMMDQLTYLERQYNYPPKEDVFDADSEI